MVTVQKQEQLRREMQEHGILEIDLEETFVRSSGRGGQNVNKVATCVVLKHRPSGLIVKVQQERSQSTNRFLARRRLLEKYKSEILKIETKKKQAQEKIRRQKRRRSRKAKEKVLEEKGIQAEKKKGRARVAPEDD